MSIKRRPTSRVRTIDDLVQFFRAEERPRRSWAVGVEYEKFGVLRESGKPLPYSGPRSVEAVLKFLARRFRWRPYLEDGRLLALKRFESSITLEPGGQVELSGKPHRNLHDACSEIHKHLNEMRAAGEEFQIDWLALGVHPFATLDEISWLPKERYRIMRRYLPARGSSGLDMMKRTCGVQANFDWESEKDAARKMRTAMGVSPIVAAIFANSPIINGRLGRDVSARQRIWFDTDPDRCGVLPFVFREGFGYRDYAEWAADVPMFLMKRNGTVVLPRRGGRAVTFRQYMAEGFQGQQATLGDWDMHLSTLFPDVRLRRTIEVRTADSNGPALCCALPALWKGILYDVAATEAAWRLVSAWSLEDRVQLARAVARQGLSARLRRRSVIDLARELFRIAVASLRKQSVAYGAGRSETIYLDPLRPYLFEWNASPGEVLQREWRTAPERDRAKLLGALRY